MLLVDQVDAEVCRVRNYLCVYCRHIVERYQIAVAMVGSEIVCCEEVGS